ncbi:hypothetical protein [Streptomyces sp. NPDC027717]|uniref:hypothetical protein n=1 Tax=Streptomyces sp. NPDC027717 TaxID=3155765 RepID=UPI00340D7B77
MSETGEAPAQSRDALLEESMAVVEDTHNLHVLTKAAVIAGIGALKAQRIHEHFPAYLQLRKLAVASGSLTKINPDWKEVSDLLKMPGGPPTKPHYRPFSSVNRRDETGYWYNRNLAGSYAPKSIRATSSFMLNANGDDYALPTDHAQLALDKLLKGTKVPAWALATYYLRNYGFAFEGEGGYDELITAFRKEFCFGQDTDFDVIFEDNEPIQFTEPWFEPFDQASGNESDHKEGARND